MTTPTPPTVPVSERALLGRINRRLRAKNEFLTMRVSRRGNEQTSLGNYYIRDDNLNTIEASGIDDLAEWAKQEYPDILKPYEVLA